MLEGPAAKPRLRRHYGTRFCALQLRQGDLRRCRLADFAAPQSEDSKKVGFPQVIESRRASAWTTIAARPGKQRSARARVEGAWVHDEVAVNLRFNPPRGACEHPPESAAT
jgi:hypothetical protein